MTVLLCVCVCRTTFTRDRVLFVVNNDVERRRRERQKLRIGGRRFEENRPWQISRLAVRHGFHAAQYGNEELFSAEHETRDEQCVVSYRDGAVPIDIPVYVCQVIRTTAQLMFNRESRPPDRTVTCTSDKTLLFLLVDTICMYLVLMAIVTLVFYSLARLVRVVKESQRIPSKYKTMHNIYTRSNRNPKVTWILYNVSHKSSIVIISFSDHISNDI